MRRVPMLVMAVVLWVASAACKDKINPTPAGEDPAASGSAGSTQGGTEAPKPGAMAGEAKVISKPADVHAMVDLSVVEVTAATPKGAQVVIGVANKTSSPLRLIGFQLEADAQLLDRDGFSSTLDIEAPGQLNQGLEVPPNAKVKGHLIFKGDPVKAAKVRLWGKELNVPGVAP